MFYTISPKMKNSKKVIKIHGEIFLASTIKAKIIIENYTKNEFIEPIKESSSLLISLENLLRILAIGTLSKNLFKEA
jgi:hypothetical protein